MYLKKKHYYGNLGAAENSHEQNKSQTKYLTWKYLSKPKSDQTGFFQTGTRLWLLRLRWCGKHKSQLSAKKPGLPRLLPRPWCGVNRDPGSPWLILDHPCVLESPWGCGRGKVVMQGPWPSHQQQLWNSTGLCNTVPNITLTLIPDSALPLK